MSNLVIVESPAKCKTIKKILGKDFEVMASFGHIADLAKKNMGVDIENNFAPDYLISAEKKKVVRALKAAAKKVDTVWIATDEDREGEAIGWHVARALALDVDKTPRIVFHEITKPAIQAAIKKPRTLDMDLVNAQQARRILDRLVGFELSPVLWKKIKGGLSAGRVQSVAVRLLVDREREIQSFAANSRFKVEAACAADSKPFVATLKDKLDDQETARALLESCKDARYSVKSVTTKPSKKSAPAPFTTSTLQQAASQRLGFAVNQTMRVAQKLYEAGHITYMRTDSVAMSAVARKDAAGVVTSKFGVDYSKPTQYKGKTSNAQEAHECIRPTRFGSGRVGNTSQEEKLYRLIWQRAIASQMTPALLDKTKAVIDISTSKHTLVAEGEVLTFAGFLVVYADDKAHEDKLLPPLTKGQVVTVTSLSATETYDRHPPRYTEASLVKALEAAGIGRPSTYAPTIGTVQRRGYVELTTKPGVKTPITVLTLKDGTVSAQTKSKMLGGEKKKLFPTDMGMIVTDFLVANFPDIVDYQFTAHVEQDFDDIASGKRVWTEMLTGFYEPFHRTVAQIAETAERQTGERQLGTDPETGKPVIARLGRYGPLVQLGDAEDEDKKFASLKGNMRLETITLEEAMQCFALPRALGEHEGQSVSASIGRFGPYVKWGSIFASLRSKEQEFDPYTITLEEAIPLIEAKAAKKKEATIHTWEYEGKTYVVEKGRRGAFLRVGRKNVPLPAAWKKEPEKLTLEACLEIAAAALPSKTKKKTSSKIKKTNKTSAKKISSKKTTTTKKTISRKKASKK